jgi:hypothetical protein
MAGHAVLESEGDIAAAPHHAPLPAESVSGGAARRIDDGGIALGEIGVADGREQ